MERSLRMPLRYLLQINYLILESVSAIQAGTNPRVVEQILATYLPDNERGKVGESSEEKAAA